MKKIFSLLAGLAMICNFSSCSDDEYTEKYPNPGETTTVSCEKLMTGVFYTGARFTYNSYYRMFTWENASLGRYAQTIGFTNSEGNRYSVEDSRANDRWEDFYKTLAQFRLLQRTYEQLSDEDKKIYRVFYCLSEIFIYDHLAQVIDAFGDVPYTKAAYLGLTNDVAGSYPSYDKATDLYSMMLDNLGSLNTELQSISANLPALTAAYLEPQDFINNGDLSKWIKYCNSLRLRLAMRVASQGELAAKGQSVIQEILNNNYSVVDELNSNIVALSDDNGDSSTGANPPGLNYGDGFRDGFKDHSRASQQMLNVLQTEATLGENDPRLVILYSKNADGEYKGYSVDERYADQVANGSRPEDSRIYSRIDSTTIIYNRNLKSPIVTASEVYFAKAEAYQKGWASGDAKGAFVEGVVESVKFYYDLNNTAINTQLTASPIRKVDMPAENDVRVYAEKLWNAATNKEEVIMTQKWLNFGFLQSAQAWNEIRRTGYPVLNFPEDPLSTILKTPAYRVIYPISERNYNAANYREQVATMPDGDSYYTKLFWAK